MASRLASKIVPMETLPLWKRRSPRYPVYWKGNPQLRVFLPLFWMKMVKQERESPPDRVTFIVHPEMSKFDVSNYLEKIYQVTPLNIRTDIRQGEDILHPNTGKAVAREDDYKLAFIQLRKAETFEFPDIFKDKVSPSQRDADGFKDMAVKSRQEKEKFWDKLSVPAWFR